MKCDLCGVEKSEWNKACPQHRMWKAEAERDEAREAARRFYVWTRSASGVGMPFEITYGWLTEAGDE